jgi:hypothetical protein
MEPEDYRNYKSPPLVPILNHIDLVHTILCYLSKLRFNIVHPPIRVGLHTDLFHSGFPTNILHAFLFSQFVLNALPISISLSGSF